MSSSTTPIVGASVGIYGLLAFTLVQALKRSFHSVWYLLIVLVLFSISLALLYQRYVDGFITGTYNSIQAALLLGALMHFTGFAIGIWTSIWTPISRRR